MYSRYVPGAADVTLHISASQISWHHDPLITNTVYSSRKLFDLACPLHATRGSTSLSSNQRTHLLPEQYFSVTNDNKGPPEVVLTLT